MLRTPSKSIRYVLPWGGAMLLLEKAYFQEERFCSEGWASRRFHPPRFLAASCPAHIAILLICLVGHRCSEPLRSRSHLNNGGGRLR